MSAFSKLLIILYPLVIYYLLSLLFRLLRLRKRTSLKTVDFFIPFLVFGLYSFSKAAVGSSLLPYYFLIISGMALIFLLVDLFYYRKFDGASFFKQFWRASFFVSIVCYLALIVVILLA